MGARIFISYSHKDESLRDQLEIQLSILKRQGLIEVWHDRRLLPGDHFDWTISKQLDNADIILLLISPDFLDSDYCYRIERGRAFKRHLDGSARMISVILRPCDWQHTELAKFLVTPKDGKPISRWLDRDEALLDVATSIRRTIEDLGIAVRAKEVHDHIGEATQTVKIQSPRSSNLRLRKEFTKADADEFVLDVFEFMDRFFQGSLDELQIRHPDIQTRHRRIDANCFTAAIYRNGEKVTSCTVQLGGMLNNGISYANSDNVRHGAYNESISVDNDDQKLFLRPMGMPQIASAGREDALSHEGAAEYYWALLIRPIQGN